MAKKIIINIKESEKKLKKLLRKIKVPRLRERIHMLYLMKSKKITRRKELKDILAKHIGTIVNWLNKYKKGGLKGLLTIDKYKKESSINDEILQKLKEKLSDSEGFASYDEIIKWLYKEFGIEFSYWTTFHAVHRKLKAKPKVVRPCHYKQDEKKKMNSKQC